MEAVGIDFQGWPIYRLTLRELLGQLGATLDDCGRVGFEDGDPILDLYPRVFEDDGMGYGVNEKCIITADHGDEYINIFVDVKDEQFRRDELGGDEVDQDATVRGSSES